MRLGIDINMGNIGQGLGNVCKEGSGGSAGGAKGRRELKEGEA